MKKQLLTLLGTSALLAASAQNTGTVTYEEKIKLEIKLDGDDEKMMADLPKERTSRDVLYFTPAATLYRADKKQEPGKDIDHESEDGGHVVIKMHVPDDNVYCDLKNNKLIEQRDFMSRKFLIESDLSKIQWKLTGNQKMILNYPCQEAILQDTTKKVTAWFTSAIPLSSGPNGYANLPGLILSVDLDNGRRVINVVSVDMKEIDASILVKPKEGKKVSKEEFNKIVEEKKKEMQEQYSGNGNMIIKIKN